MGYRVFLCYAAGKMKNRGAMRVMGMVHVSSSTEWVAPPWPSSNFGERKRYGLSCFSLLCGGKNEKQRCYALMGMVHVSSSTEWGGLRRGPVNFS